MGVDCADGSNSTSREGDEACSVDVDAILQASGCKQDFGYSEGKPCVAVKMNKVIAVTLLQIPSDDSLLAASIRVFDMFPSAVWI